MTGPLTNFDMTSDRLLTEVERQQEYLARLPEYCAFQFFSVSGGTGVAAA